MISPFYIPESGLNLVTDPVFGSRKRAFPSVCGFNGLRRVLRKAGTTAAVAVAVCAHLQLLQNGRRRRKLLPARKRSRIIQRLRASRGAFE